LSQKTVIFKEQNARNRLYDNVSSACVKRVKHDLGLGVRHG